MKEIFKDIPGYEEIYQVSNLGRVKSLTRVSANGHILKQRFMKPYINFMGVQCVNIKKNKKQKFIAVHQLVWMTFIDSAIGWNSPEGYWNEIHYIDPDDRTPSLGNLYRVFKSRTR